MCNNFYILQHNFGFSPTRLTPFCCCYAPKALKGAVNALQYIPYTMALRKNLLVKVFQVPQPCD